MTSRGIPRLFVGNIPWTIGHKELRDYFAQFGQIQHAHVFYDKITGMSRNFGFVQFFSRDGYVNSSNTTDHFLEGNKLKVTDMLQEQRSGNQSIQQNGAQQDGRSNRSDQRRL
ncbi:hypothetical protein BV898_16182 [Hypsibius exemplaris]|uniref:RRM domain-containing protein n=1 Tax=Hypsibius exemplaris TaxID=2072580 RepID=A0A9X6RL83_HYPEX|nr:hypothetical protein BV898_16182 [Hypsibius exemplaris]